MSNSVPALTGTTAPTSPSESLSPAPDSSSFAKKRKAPAAGGAAKKARAEPKANGKAEPKSKSKDEKPEKGTYCHQ
jgi:hypothetical protein